MQEMNEARDFCQLSTCSPCAAEKSILGCGRERADIHRSLSLLRERKATTIITRNNIIGQQAERT